MSTTPTNPEPRIPDSITSDLRAAYRSPVHVPDSVDQALLDLARNRPVKRRRIRPWTLAKWAGVAAAVVAAFLVPTLLSRHSQLPSVALHSGDVNHDGVIDILDAFDLARARLAGNNTITSAEVDAAAAAAVRLSGGGA